jgi:hypothetical protein
MVRFGSSAVDVILSGQEDELIKKVKVYLIQKYTDTLTGVNAFVLILNCISLHTFTLGLHFLPHYQRQ